MNAVNAVPRKNRGYVRQALGLLTEEWFVELVLVVAVVTVIVDRFASLGGSSIA